MKHILLCILLWISSPLFAQNRFDVVIDEIMSDPTPSLGLPGNEWLELKNTTTVPVNLQNWRLADATGQSGPMPNYLLQPDSFVIVCSGSAVNAMTSFGTTFSVTSFPSLANDGDLLVLKAADGTTIHAVNYSSSWFQNTIKAAGGWTLEMIDTKSPCAGASNWTASINPLGGTPGNSNSVNATNQDANPPHLKSAYTTDNVTIILVFDEPLDSLSGATTANYSLNNGLTISNAITLSPLFNEVQLTTNSALSPNTVYTVIANNVADCKSNVIGTSNIARTGLPSDANAGDLIINEILFNPRPNGFDYVELYNSGEHILDASKLHLANRNSSGVVNSAVTLSVTPFYIFPGDYIVETEDMDNLEGQYLVKNPGQVLSLTSLPSFPDDAGDVVILNYQGDIVDEVKYRDDWHFKLIDDDEGVSLERINAAGPSQDQANWHSAASTAGYGTPTYLNSENKQPGAINATIQANPKIFSPDNDDFDDIAIIQYKLKDPGYVANVTIFDAAGRPVRNLVRNGTLALSGYWNWDGLDDKGLKLPVGTYILFTEIFNLQGKRDKFKNTVVLARKLK